VNISNLMDSGPLAGIYIIELFIIIFRWWWCWNNVVSILTRLRDGKVRYYASIPGRDKRFLSCLQHPDLLWVLSSLLLKSAGHCFPGGNVDGMCS